MKPLIAVDSITYTYKPNTGASVPALRKLSLQIAAGEHVAIVGANGSGKSTLARHLNALLLPDTGTVRINGLDTRVTAHHPEIRRLVGMVFQRPEDQTVATLVEHDVAFGPENLGLPPAEIRSRVQHALLTVGLWEHRQRPPHMLSAGQMQRLALAGILAMRPDCIIFDEVTAMLDPEGRRAARTLMKELHAEDITLIRITHLMEETLDAQRVVVLHRGAVVMDGTPQEIFRDAGKLQCLGLDVPPVARLADALRRHVSGLPENVLTVADLVDALDRIPHHTTSCHNPPSLSPSPQGPTLIESAGLGHIYMRDTPFAHRALKEANLMVHEGCAHGLIGATGTGKSTLLQHLNGLLKPQEGTLNVIGYPLHEPQTDVRAVRQRVGLVFQTPETQIFEQYVGDEIAYGPRLTGLVGAALRDRVSWAMALVGLDFEAFKDRFTFALSGGEKRKVALASILALQPRILLLDEPTAGLDPASRRDLIARLRTLSCPRGGPAPLDSGADRSDRPEMTLILSSHQMEDIADLTEELTVMANNTTVLHGSMTQVFSQREQLQAWGLEQPVVIRLADELRARGWCLPEVIANQEDLLAQLRCRLATPR